jgi:DNA primase
MQQCDLSREVAIITQSGYFTRNLVVKDQDSLKRILSSAASVYASVERFNDPLKPETRFGWDFVIDLDGKDWNQTKWIAGQLFRDVILPQFKITHYKLKFSGRRGIHIIIPEEAFLFYFSERDFAHAYPLVPSQIARFFDAMIYPESKKSCHLDMQVYQSRRLLRCAYSLHEETGLASTPIWPEDLDRFDPTHDANPSRIEVDEEWLKIKPSIGEASYLLDKVAEWIANRPPPKKIARLSTHRRKREGRLTPCIEKFHHEGFSKGTEGYRNLVLYNIIQAVKRFNLPLDPNSLLNANSKSQSPLPEREVKAMLRYHFERRANHSYSFNCEAMQHAGLCPSEGCWLRRRKQ